jgi:hypothetical protein
LPERINAYAQAVIRTLQADEHQRGCLMEERVLKSDLLYESSMERLHGDEERFVLLAMHQTLVERGIQQPGRAKDNSPAIHLWVCVGRGDKSRQGRKKICAGPADLRMAAGPTFATSSAAPPGFGWIRRP